MIDEKEEVVASYLMLADIEMLQTFVDKTIIANNQPMIGKIIYQLVKDKLSRKDMSEASFMCSFSANVRGGYIVGIKGQKRVGYIPCDRAEPKAKPQDRTIRARKSSEVAIQSPLPKSEPKIASPVQKPLKAEQEPNEEESIPPFEPGVLSPSVVKPEIKIRGGYKYAHHIWIGRNSYKLNRTFNDLRRLVIDVLDGRKDENGTIVFDGETYYCENVQVIEKFIVEFLGAISIGESDPVLNDGSGIPVELRIAS